MFGHESGRAPPRNRPILQVLHIKPLKEGRFRLILSDTEHFVQSMLATSKQPI
jgi:hypothetical protein